MRRLVPALAALLACAACAVPIFDPAMSDAVKTFRASHLIGASNPTIGPDTNSDGKPDWDLKSENLTFMPQRGDLFVDAFNGFVIRRADYSSWNQIWYQWWDVDRVRWLSSPAGYDEEEGLLWRWPVSVKGGPYLGTIIFNWDDMSTNLERLWADTGMLDCDWNPTYGTYDPGMDIDAEQPAISGEPVIVGAGMRPLTGSGDDRLEVGDVASQQRQERSIVAARLLEVGAHARAQAGGLADVQHAARLILEDVAARTLREVVELRLEGLGDHGS